MPIVWKKTGSEDKRTLHLLSRAKMRHSDSGLIENNGTTTIIIIVTTALTQRTKGTESIFQYFF